MRALYEAEIVTVCALRDGSEEQGKTQLQGLNEEVTLHLPMG